MSNIDEELKWTLARHEPPPDFTTRIMAAVADRERIAQVDPLWPRISRAVFGRWAAVAATTLIIGGGVVYQQHERVVQGESAKNKLLLALQITGAKLHDAQQVLSGGAR